MTFKWYVGATLKQRAAAATWTYAPSVAGTFTLVLEATDARGDLKSQQVQVNVATTGTCLTGLPSR
jgi:hypothetical protein